MEEFPVLDLTYLEGLTQLHRFEVMLHFYIISTVELNWGVPASCLEDVMISFSLYPCLEYFSVLSVVQCGK